MTKFWLSTRFWALVGLGVVMTLGAYNLVPAEVVNLFYVVLGGHIGLRSLDRVSEQFNRK